MDEHTCTLDVFASWAKEKIDNEMAYDPTANAPSPAPRECATARFPSGWQNHDVLLHKSTEQLRSTLAV